MTSIRDPIHGYLRLNDEEKEVVDTDPMQRLRYIRQLGFSSLVYPGATHSRFEHSLGVMHVAGKFADSLGVDEKRKRELRMAALLHDSGHGPFSHSSEKVLEEEGNSHEDISCEIAEKLDENHSLNTERIKKMIKGANELGKIISGDIDADRMDYLMRDSHSSGLPHGKIDHETIIRCAEKDSGKIMFNSKAVSAIESFLTARFHMYKTLYNHHAARISKKMLSRAIRIHTREDMNIEDLMRKDDMEADRILRNSDTEASEIFMKLKQRKLYKRCMEWGIGEISPEQIRSIQRRLDKRKVEMEIAEKVGIEPYQVIIDPPEIPESENFSISIRENERIRPFTQFSAVQDSIESAEWRNVKMKVYGPEEKRKEIEKAAEDILKGYKSVLDSFT